VLGGMPIYIAYDDAETPFYVDKEGYQLVEYYEVIAADPLPSDGRISSNVTLDPRLDDGLGNTVEGGPVVIEAADTSAFNTIGELIDLINAGLDAGDFTAVEAIERDGQLVLWVTGYEIALGAGSANLDQLGLDSRQTAVRFFYTDDAGQFLDDQGFVVNAQGLRLDSVDDDPVNEFGYLVDEYGNFLNDFRRAINAYGDRVDRYGNLIADDETTLISSDGYKINEDGLLLNSSDGLLNGVGAIRGSVEIDGTDYLTDQYGNLVSSEGELVVEIDGSYYLANERGELIDADGIPIVGFQTPVEADGVPVVVDPETLEEPVGGYERWNEGSIQLGDPLKSTNGKVLIDLPARRSGGTLNTTGPSGEITITGDKRIEIDGMVGLVKLDESETPKATVDVTQIHIASADEVYLSTDALVNAQDYIDITGTNVWALDESVTIAREPYSEVHFTADGPGPDEGKIHVARSQIYYFRAYVAAQGLVELDGYDIGVYGTVGVEGGDRDDSGDPPHSLLRLDADRHILVRGEILSGGDADLNAGLTDPSGSIVVSAEGKVAAGHVSDVDGDITMDAPGEVALLAYDDTMNDDLQFAPPYVTYEPVYVDVVTGYRRVEAGFVLRPVYHWIPTITTEQTGFDEVKVGSEFGSVETRLVQDGYYKVGFGMMDLEDAPSVASALAWAGAFPQFFAAAYSIRQRLSATTEDLLSSYSLGAEPSKALKEALVEDFNEMILGESLYDEDAFAGVSLKGETQSLLAQEVTGSDLIRLNRLLIEDVFSGIRELPKSDQFREYFIRGVEYEIEDLDWPGKYDPSVDFIYVSWIDLGRLIGPEDTDDDAVITRELFEQVTTYTDPIVDAGVAYAQGATVNNAVTTLLAEDTQPPLLVSMGPVMGPLSPAAADGAQQLYTAQTFSQIHAELTNFALQGTQYKAWEDLTDTEQIDAILAYTGYEKLFDVQFLSGFKRTVTFAPEVEVDLVRDDAMLAAVHGKTLDEIAALAEDDGGSATAIINAEFRAVDPVGQPQYALDSDAAPMMQGVMYEFEDAGSPTTVFVPGVFVEDTFQATATLDVVDTLAALDVFLNLESYEVHKKYFDFWFSEFEPFDPAVHFTPYEGTRFATVEEAALAHWMPPYEMLVEAMEGLVAAGVPERFLNDEGELVFSQEEALDFAEIRHSDFTTDGDYMTAAEASAIYTAIQDVVEALADDFFIAGIDYDEDYSNPDKEGTYIASFFAREDAILAEDNWEKLYSPTEGLGRINRNLEGIPTATFWELDFTGATRAVEPYELDDGTDIFLRAPKEWWETYTVTALGNDRTDSDAKTLQYVGNVDTYDETVGYVRNVAQLEYTQEWSWAEEQGEPSNPAVGDLWVTKDCDDGPARWVVSYREDPHPDWTDEYTSYEQYSIFDGRETDEVILPYVSALFTGLVQLRADAIADHAPDGDFSPAAELSPAAAPEGDSELAFLLLDPELASAALMYEMLTTGDHSVKVPWDREDWDLGQPGEVDDTGKLVYEIAEEGGGTTYYQTTSSSSLSGSDDLPGGPGGVDVFTGNNWDFGTDANGLPVFGQKNVGNDVLEVSQNGVQLEHVSTSSLAADDVAMVKEWLGSRYLKSYYTYTWEDARTLFSPYWHLVVINDADENATVWGIADGEDVWLGGTNLNGTSHNSWTMDWVDGTSISASSGFSNFHPDEPNNEGPYHDEDQLMMWGGSGYWNDLNGTEAVASPYKLRGVYERDPRWSAPDELDETWENYIYKLKTPWDSIQDVRSDITYRVFTDAHDIVDKRPRYETIETEVPVIKMEQVTNWAYVPVTEQRLDWSGSVVTPDGPLDLSVFDLDTLTASGAITITAAGNVLAKASMHARGDTSTIAIESTAGDVTVGGEMPDNPMIFDIVELTATQSIEITAAGEVTIGETATLGTTAENEDEPDVSLTATGGSVEVAGQIDARHAVDISAATDVLITGQITAENSVIRVFAGEGAGGEGGIIVHQQPDGDPGDDLDETRQRTSLGGVLHAGGEDGLIHLRAGATAGDISLLDASITAHSVTLDAPAGSVIQSSGTEDGDDETPPSTGGMIDAVELAITSTSGITLENSALEDISIAVTGPGDIVVRNVGFRLSPEGDELILPENVTVTNLETADGSITFETIGQTLNVINVESHTDSDDNDISITATALVPEGDPLEDGGLAVELHDVAAAGQADVELDVQGTITQPDGSLVASQATVSTFGSVGTETAPLTTEVDSLSVAIAGHGDLFVENTSADLTLADVELANGSVEVTTHGDLLAENVVLKTDWDSTDTPPSANEVVLRTAEGSGGTITVVNITGGVYAATPEEAAQVRLDLLNALLAEMDATTAAEIPAELKGTLTDEDDNPVLDEFGEPIVVVKLDLPEAEELATIVAGALAAADDPYVLDEADFVAVDEFSPMTGHVAFVIYTWLLDTLGVTYEATFTDDGTDQWDQTRQDRVFSETTGLLTLTKGLTSQGKVTLEADGGIAHGAGSQTVSIVADQVTLIADAAISDLNLAVNSIVDASSLSADAISLFDKDGFGESSPGLELAKAEGGAVTVMAESGFVVDQVTSHGASNTLTLGSVNHNLFVRESGGSLHSDGDILLSADGDLVVNDNLIAGNLIGLDAGGYLSTFEREVTLQAKALRVDAGSSVSLSGHVGGLSELDVASTGNVNLMDEVQGRKGFNVFVESVAQQQAIMQALQDNLQAQAEMSQALEDLQRAAWSLETGQQESLDAMSNAFLQGLVTLPHDVQRRQLETQYAGLQSLLDVQAVLPDTIDQMWLDLDGEQEILWYADLVAQREQLRGEIANFEGLLLEVQPSILQITAANLTQQLQSVNETIGARETYRQGLDGMRLAVGGEMWSRGQALPTEPGAEVVPAVDPAALGTLALDKLDAGQLDALYRDLWAAGASVEQELGSLAEQRSGILTQMEANPNTLAWIDHQLTLIDKAPALLAAMQNQIDDLTTARDAIVSMVDTQSYQFLDSQLRGLAAHADLLGAEIQWVMQDLSQTRTYQAVQADLASLGAQLFDVQQALEIVLGLIGTTDYQVLDAGLRQLEQYSGLLTADLQGIIGQLVLEPPLAADQASLIGLITDTQKALDITASLIDEADHVRLDAGLRDLANYQHVLDPAFVATLQNFLTKAPTPLSVLQGDLGMVQDAMLWRQELDQVEGQLVSIDSSIASKQESLIGVDAQLAQYPPLDAVLEDLNQATIQVTDKNRELSLVDDGLAKLADPVKLFGDSTDALVDRYQWNPQEIPTLNVSYTYDPLRGGLIQYGRETTIALKDLDRILFYDNKTTEEELIVARSAMLNNDFFRASLTMTKSQLDDELVALQDNVGQLDAERITIEGLQDQRAGLLSDIAQLESDKEPLIVRQGELRELLRLEELLDWTLADLKAEEQRLQGEVSVLQDSLGQPAGELSGEWLRLKDQLLTLQEHQDLLDQAQALLSAEQESLEGQQALLQPQYDAVEAEQGQIEGILNQVSPLLYGEEQRLEGEIGILAGRRKDLETDFQRAIAQRDELLAGRTVLVGQLEPLYSQEQFLKTKLADFNGQVAQLDDYELRMQADLDAIIQQKWTERFQLGDLQAGDQQIEADVLRVVHDLWHTQGATTLGDTVRTYRDRLDSHAADTALLSGQLETLRSQEADLRQQLLQAQLAATEPTSIRIVALGSTLSPADTDLPHDGQRVAQDEFSGFFLYEYEGSETGRYFYRDVKGLFEDDDGNLLYSEDDADDVFHVWAIELEQIDGAWYYRDTRETPDDTADDVLYAWQGAGEVPEELYPFDSAYVVRKFRDVTTDTHVETRINEEGEEEQHTVVIESDRFTINDYRYRVLASAVTEQRDPDLESGELYVLDAVSGNIVSFAEILEDNDDATLEDAIVLYPDQTLADLGIDEVARNDVVVRFSEFTPVLTPLPSGEFTFVDPEDYSGTEVEEVPDLFTELIHDGQLVVPVIVLEDGNVNLEQLSLSASDSLTVIADNQIKGLNFGEALSAGTVTVQSGADLHVGGSLLGVDLVDVRTDGDLYLDDGALIDAEMVTLASTNGAVIGSEDSLVAAEQLVVETATGLVAHTDVDDFVVHVLAAGDVAIFDAAANGTVDLTDVGTARGDVAVSADTTIRAFHVAGNNVQLTAAGEGSIELGTVETLASTVTLDAARYIRAIPGIPPSVIADEVDALAGLDVTVPEGVWLDIDRVGIRDNLSVLIDENYTGPLSVRAERDIIIDTEIVAYEPIVLNAANIVFTEHGGIRNLSGETMLNATGELRFAESTPGGRWDIPTIEGSDVTITAAEILGGQNALIGGERLSVVADSGFGLRTSVTQLNAEVLGPGDLSIDALSSIELTDVRVFDGDLEVVSGGSITARDVLIATDRYSNRLDLSAAGTISLQSVKAGQLVQVNVESAGPVANVGRALIVTPGVVSEVVYEGEEALFRVEVRDPSRTYRPADGLHVELEVDFGDGTPTEVIQVPYVEPGPELFPEASLLLKGEQAGGWLGQAVATTGDVNGDGFDDLILGDQRYEGRSGKNAGRVLVYLGSRDGLIPEPVTILEGRQSEAGFGTAVSFIGDVNRDGFGDVMVGAPGQVSQSTRIEIGPDGQATEMSYDVKGEVVIFLGSEDGISPQPFWSVASDEFGLDHYSLAAGDLNTDGFVDVVIGSPNSGVDLIDDAQLVHLTEAGIVRVFLGSEKGLSREPSVTYQGEQTGGHFGNSVQVVGDVDGDGFSDLLIGAPDESNQVGAGRAYLFPGSESGSSRYPHQILEGDQNQDRFGASVASAGDLNHDGFADVVIGAPRRLGPAGGEGAAFLYFGSKEGLAGEPLIVEPGNKALRFGWEVAAAGDVNADGYDDVFVRALEETGTKEIEGRVFLYLGTEDGLSDTVFQLQETKETVADVDLPRRSIAGAGDFNNDGFHDFAVGAWQSGDNQQGAVFVHQGRELPFDPPLIALVDSLPHTYQNYGNYTLTVTVPQTEMQASYGSMRVNVQGAPRPLDDAATTDEETALSIAAADLLANDLDPDAGDVVSFAGIDTTGLIGLLTDNGDGTFDYDPNGRFEYLAEGESATDRFSYMVVDQSGRTGTASVVITILGVDEPAVVGRHVFYNNSAFDGNDPAADAADDQAVAIDKTALLPGRTATFANYTSYYRGINGIMVDIAHWADPGDVTVDTLSEYFRFRVGNTDDPAAWTTAPTPSGVTICEHAGDGGSHRVTITWPDYAITNRWLEVTVLAAGTGLVADDVFYFGNAVAEAGNSNTDARTTVIDLLLARNNRNILFPTALDDPYDYNRDRRVNVTDVLLARNNQTSFIDALDLIHPAEARLSSDPAATSRPARQATEPAPLADAWSWLYGIESTDAADRPARKPDPAAEAVDRLLAMYSQ